MLIYAMASDAVEKITVPRDFDSTRAAILGTFDKLQKWREEHMQKFQNMQLLESEENMHRHPSESKKYFDQFLEHEAKIPDSTSKEKHPSLESCSLSSGSEKNVFECNDTLQQSSVTGHLQGCFDVSSQNGPSVDESKMKGGSGNLSDKPKRPFLKKGTGLLRYRPDSAKSYLRNRNKVPTKSNNFLERNTHLKQKSAQLKPNYCTADIPPRQVRHVRFDVPENVEFQTNLGKTLSNDNKNAYKGISKSSASSFSSENSVSQNNQLDLPMSENERMNMLKENKELEEFELLEDCAQNSSFNSDSSIVQRILRVEPYETLNNEQKKPVEMCNAKTDGFADKDKNESSVSSIFSPKLGLSKYLNQAKKEIHVKKLQLQSTISEHEMRIQSLQKEMSGSKAEAPYDESHMSKNCNSPIEDKRLEEKSLLSAAKKNSHVVSSDLPPSSTSSEYSKSETHISDYQDRSGGISKGPYSNNHSITDEEDLSSKFSKLPLQNNQSNERTQILQKLQDKEKELEKEIEIYQMHNANLASTCKERDEALKKLQKEQEEFNKYKEEQKKKFEAEMEEKQRQFRREKQVFTKLQKSSKENSTRKSREELNALHEEVEKLQEELKRQKMKHTNEIRKLKSRLDAAEKDKNSFKQENIRLQEENKDLLAVLKARLKKRPNISMKEIDKTDDRYEKFEKELDTEDHAQEKHFKANLKLDQVSPRNSSEKKNKSKMQFNLENGSQSYHRNSPETTSGNKVGSPSVESYYHTDTHETSDYEEHSTVFEGSKTGESVSKTSASNQSEVHQIKHASAEEDCMSPFEKENFMTESCKISDNYKYLSAPGETDGSTDLSVNSQNSESEFKEFDHGNKIERIYKNGEKVIRFLGGTKKFVSADGNTTRFYFYNGDVKEILPDKKEVIRYVNGVTETKFPDGLEITEFPSGQVQKVYPDGKKEVKTPNGTIRSFFADGSEELRKTDGTRIKVNADGTETRLLPNGQIEIRTATYRRREFPDGSVKTAYINGRVETRFSNGRIRIKDKEGKIIVDTKYLPISSG